MGWKKKEKIISKSVAIIIIGLVICSFSIIKININRNRGDYFSETPDNLKISSDIEPNDNFTNAVEVYSGNEWPGFVGFGDDYDYYKIYVLTTQFLYLTLIYNAGGGDPLNFTIYDTNQNPIDSIICGKYWAKELSCIPSIDGMYYFSWHYCSN